MTRPLEIDDLYRLRVPSDPVLSLDGSAVAFVLTHADRERDENVAALWIVAAEAGSDPRPLTSGRNDRHPRWSPRDPRVLAFIRPGSGDAKPQVWRLSLDGGEPVQLTSFASGVSAFAWSPDGTRMAVSSAVDLEGEPDDEDREQRKNAPVVVTRLGYKADGQGLVRTRRQHLFVVDVPEKWWEPAGDPPRRLTDGDFNAGGPAWSPDGTSIAYVAAVHEDRDLNPGSSLFVIGADGGEARQVSDTKGTAAGPLWMQDGRIVHAGSFRTAPGHTRLLAVAAEGGEREELAPDLDRNVMLGAPAYPGAPLRTLPDGSIVFCARDRGCTHIYRLPASGGPPEKIVGGADRTASGTSSASGRLAYLVATPDTTGEIAVSAADGTGETVLTDFGAELGDVSLAVPEERTFAVGDGTEVHGWVIRSRTATGTPGPLLLDVHGGPHNAWSPVFDGVHLYHHVLASAGWTVLILNPRGSDGYGEHFYTGVVEGWGTADAEDFLSPVQALVEEGVADSAKLAITGYSYGGFTTCWLTSRTDRFAAAVTGGCVSNLVSMFGTSDAGFWLGTAEIGGDVARDPGPLVEHSPITHVGSVTAPTLVLHGESDDRCPVEQAEQWFAALRANGVTTEFVRYPGASHIFIALGRPSHRADYNRRVVDWVTRFTS